MLPRAGDVRYLDREIKNEPEKNFISNIKNEPEKNFVSNIKNEPEKNFASNIKNEPEKDFVPNISTVDGQKEGDTTNVFQNVFPKYSESDVKYQPIESTEVDEQDEKKNLFYKDGEADKNSENNKEIAESAVNIENTKLDNIHSIKNEDQSSFMSEVAESNAKYDNLVIRKDFGHDQIHYFKPNTSRKKRNRKKKSMKSQSSKSSEKISGEHQNFSASSSPDIDPKDYIEKLSNASSSSTEENATNQASSVKVSSCSLNIKAPLLKKPPCSVSQSQPHENYGFFSGPVIAGPSKIHVKRPSSLASSRPGLLDGPTPQKKAPVLQQSSLKPPLLGEFPRLCNEQLRKLLGNE
ncbi:unnamed protein product [Dracunculus medinensis]|uniref:Uncharacterized protein n=1 Tax=Dracunculus medinensis TaxID=318479 RepID=A0A158Q2Y1_DRAME|nr:unnamed protein product [Dracunculus medinensis]